MDHFVKKNSRILFIQTCFYVKKTWRDGASPDTLSALLRCQRLDLHSETQTGRKRWKPVETLHFLCHVVLLCPKMKK